LKMSSNRGSAKEGGDAIDSFEYDWVASAKNASFSLEDDAKKNNNAKKGTSSNASSEAGSAISEVSCDSLSIMEWATDLLSPGNKNAQDVFAETTPKQSPLRHRKIPAPRLLSKRQDNFPVENRLPKNDLPGPLTRSFPNWAGTPITADARKSDEVSVITPLGEEIELNYPNATLTNYKHAASDPSNFGNWDEFEASKWDACPEPSQFSVSDSEEGSNKQPRRQPRNKRKLIWVGSVAVFLILIIAIAVPLSKKSKNAPANSGKENIWATSDDETSSNNEDLLNGQSTTVPVESGPTPSQPAPSPEREPALTEDEGYVNGQATIVPVESNPSQPHSAPSPANEPVSSPVSTVVESNPTTSANDNVSSPVSTGGEPSPSAPVPVQNNEPVSSPVSTVVESNPTTSANDNVSSPVSTGGEPSPSAPVPVQNSEPVSSPVSTVAESNPTTSANDNVSSPVSTGGEPSPSAPVPVQNSEPVSSPVSTVVESNPTTSENDNVSSPVSTGGESSPSAPVPVQNNEPVSSPVSTVVESEPSPSAPVPAQNNEPVSSPVSTENNEPVEVSNSVGVQPTPSQPLIPANALPDKVSTPPPTLNPTRLPTSQPTPSCITVKLRTDKFGHETSWVLKDVDRNKEVGSVPEDTYGANEDVAQDICGLESGKYTFTIRDKYGDGMCCGNGQGKYRVFLNGRQIIVGGYFKKELSFDILVGYDPGTLTEREYQYWVGHNNRRKEFHERHGTEYVPLAWSRSLAERARTWAMTLLQECEDPSIRHDPNRKGDGENLAKNRGSNPNAGLGQLYPVESIITRWVEREMNWDWPENAHLTQALWRGSSYLGCADVEETYADGSICRVQVCRYRRSGNCDMNAFGGDWLSATLQDETSCGEQCPSEGCYVMS
jgi:hypothetical protein